MLSVNTFLPLLFLFVDLLEPVDELGAGIFALCHPSPIKPWCLKEHALRG